MDISEVQCEVLTKENTQLMGAVLRMIEKSDEMGIDILQLKDFLEWPQNHAFVASYKIEVCGFIYGYSLMSLNAAPKLFIYSVDVLNRYQNKGIGSKLFQFAVDYSKKRGYSECFVITDKGNKSACRIYEKAGGRNEFNDEIVYVINHGSNH